MTDLTVPRGPAGEGWGSLASAEMRESPSSTSTTTTTSTSDDASRPAAGERPR